MSSDFAWIDPKCSLVAGLSRPELKPAGSSVNVSKGPSDSESDCSDRAVVPEKVQKKQPGEFR